MSLIGKVRVQWIPEFQEYVVKAWDIDGNRRQEWDYFATDRDDAENTANHMMGVDE